MRLFFSALKAIGCELDQTPPKGQPITCMASDDIHNIRRFSIDQTGSIKSPHLTGLAEDNIRSAWGAFIHRKGKVVKTAGFLPRDKTRHSISVSGVTCGSYLAFGATIRQADNSWSKSKLLYQVEQRGELWITLLPVTELEVPYIYDIAPASSPILYVLEAELSMVESHVERLRQQVNLMRTSLD